jgi:hypothetical protein
MHHRSLATGTLLATAALFSSAPGHAAHRATSDRTSVEHYVRAVETVTDEVVRLAERREHRHHIPSRAMSWLRELENRADHLYVQLEKHGDDVRHTEHNYRDLAASYEDALRAEHLIGHDREVRRLFRQLRASMDGLGRAYRRGTWRDDRYRDVGEQHLDVSGRAYRRGTWRDDGYRDVGGQHRDVTERPLRRDRRYYAR